MELRPEEDLVLLSVKGATSLAVNGSLKSLLLVIQDYKCTCLKENSYGCFLSDYE